MWCGCLPGVMTDEVYQAPSCHTIIDSLGLPARLPACLCLCHRPLLKRVELLTARCENKQGQVDMLQKQVGGPGSA